MLRALSAHYAEGRLVDLLQTSTIFTKLHLLAPVAKPRGADGRRVGAPLGLSVWVGLSVGHIWPEHIKFTLGPRNVIILQNLPDCHKTGALPVECGALRCAAGTVYGDDLGTFCCILFLTE